MKKPAYIVCILLIMIIFISCAPQTNIVEPNDISNPPTIVMTPSKGAYTPTPANEAQTNTTIRTVP